MTDQVKRDENVDVDVPEKDARKSLRTPLSVALLLILFSVIAGALLGYELIGKSSNNKMASLAVTDRLDRLEQRVTVLEQKLGKEIVTPVASEEVDPHADRVSAVKDDLVDLAGALKAFEEKLNQSSQRTETIDRTAKTGQATVLAFVQMQYAVRAGLPFETERVALYSLIPESAEKLLEQLDLLQPYASEGVQRVDVLLDGWCRLEPDIQAAIRKAGAKTWQDRVVVALESLVSIRYLSQNQGKTLAFDDIKTDLAAYRVEKALNKVSELSPDVQKITQKWREQATARIQAEKAIRTIAAVLINMEQPQTPTEEPAE